MTLRDLFARKPLIGMVHLDALPGSARDAGDLKVTIRRAVEDARAIEAGGFDAVLVENFFDAPFNKSQVPASTVAAMTAACLAIRDIVALPLGVNVLRNDVRAAIAVAHVCGVGFVRCNVYVGAMVTDQGIIEGAAREAQEERRMLGADVGILADVAVKHASPLGDQPIELQAADAVERGLADALIVTGPATGTATSLDTVRLVKQAVPHTPVLVGSGLDERNVVELLSLADGAIVGTSIKADGVVSAPVDRAGVAAIVHAARSVRP